MSTATAPTKIVFLDIDGVLNTHDFNPVAMSNTISKPHVSEFNRILKETGAWYVVSSAWRYHIHRNEMNKEGFEWLLRSHGVMAGRMLGYTRPDTMIRDKNSDLVPLPNERGKQIKDWIEGCNYEVRAIVLDDLGKPDTEGWEMGIESEGLTLIKVDSDYGLSGFNADCAIHYLNGEEN
jgi:HAD domain in Swiss Army Knife RNA repair proteins